MAILLTVVCQVCGKRSLSLICHGCAERLRREAFRNDIEDEKQCKPHSHFWH
jgi:hypothetical protein